MIFDKFKIAAWRKFALSECFLVSVCNKLLLSNKTRQILKKSAKTNKFTCTLDYVVYGRNKVEPGIKRRNEWMDGQWMWGLKNCICNNRQEDQLLLGDRATRKHAKDCWNGRGNDKLSWPSNVLQGHQKWHQSKATVCKIFGRQWTKEAKIAIFNDHTFIWRPLPREPPRISP